nr:hypothetical protein [uncultured Acidocella sp.]
MIHLSLAQQLETVLSVRDVVPFEQSADEIYRAIRAKLERAGTPIGGNHC